MILLSSGEKCLRWTITEVLLLLSYICWMGALFRAGKLLVQSPQESDNGKYTCVAENRISKAEISEQITAPGEINAHYDDKPTPLS